MKTIMPSARPSPRSEAPDILSGEVVEMVPQILTLQHILVPIDFSKTSLKALHFAVPLAKQFQAKITLVHVVEFPRYGPELCYVGMDFDETRRYLEKRLEELAHRAVPPEIETETLVEGGVSFDAINTIAKDHATDLIIITTHGYSGLKHVMMGSTAERVVRHAPCPVLVVR